MFSLQTAMPLPTHYPESGSHWQKSDSGSCRTGVQVAIWFAVAMWTLPLPYTRRKSRRGDAWFARIRLHRRITHARFMRTGQQPHRDWEPIQPRMRRRWSIPNIDFHRLDEGRDIVMLSLQTAMPPTAIASPEPYELPRRRLVCKDKVDDGQNR